MIQEESAGKAEKTKSQPRKLNPRIKINLQKKKRRKKERKKSKAQRKQKRISIPSASYHSEGKVFREELRKRGRERDGFKQAKEANEGSFSAKQCLKQTTVGVKKLGKVGFSKQVREGVWGSFNGLF